MWEDLFYTVLATLLVFIPFAWLGLAQLKDEERRRERFRRFLREFFRSSGKR